MGIAPPSTSISACLNQKCFDIPFPHEPEPDSDHVLMIHTVEEEDPRLTQMIYLMKPTKPRYGLGKIEQSELIPECRFKQIPSDYKKPAVMEMHKFFALMDGCLKSEISAKWMKDMLNWDLYTNPQAEEFEQTYILEQKRQLATYWKHYMETNNMWISFYSWKDKIAPINVLTSSSISDKHGWIALDGSKVETPTTFPPYEGIILGENANAAKAIPLVQKDDNALGIDGRIQKASEQLNWTNTAIKGLEMNVAKIDDGKKQIDGVQSSLGSVNTFLNNLQFLI